MTATGFLMAIMSLALSDLRIRPAERRRTNMLPCQIARYVCVELFSLAICGLLAVPAGATDRIAPVTDIALPGPTGRFDYAAFDPTSELLWLNQMGADRTLIFDPQNRRVVGTVPKLATPTGITLAPKRWLAFVSEAGGLLARALGHGHIAVIDLDRHSVIAQLPAGRFPDGSAWVPAVGRLFVSDELGGTETVIGGTPLRTEKTIALGGEAGMSAYDPISKRVLVNVQTRGQLVALDPQTLAIVARVDLPQTCRHNHGLLVDAADRLVFVACDGNARLLALSLSDLEPVQPALTLGNAPDVLALDAARHRLIVAAESGVAAMFLIGEGRLKPMWRGFVGPDAHVVAMDPVSGLLYFPLKNRHGKPVLRVMRVPESPTDFYGEPPQ